MIVWLHWSGGGGTLLHKVLIKDEERKTRWDETSNVCVHHLSAQKPNLCNEQEDVCGSWDNCFIATIYNVL